MRHLLITAGLLLFTATPFAQQTETEATSDNSVLSVLTAWLSLNQQEQEEEAPEVSPDVMLRVVRVTEDWMPYASTDGWTQAAPIKESEALKFYEIAIWEEVDAVHLYAFTEDFDPFYGLQAGVTDQEKIDYREQFRVMRFAQMPAPNTAARSEFLLTAFKQFTDYLVAQHPDVDHHLMYSGHGGPGGRLFDAQVQAHDVVSLLDHWTGALGQRLGVVDMGGPCNKSAVSDNRGFCEFAQFYVASDLPNGGYQLDDWTEEKYQATQIEYQYHRLLADSETLLAALKGRIDLVRQRYEYARNNMVAQQVMQANYLFSCDAYNTFQAALDDYAQTHDIRQTQDLRYNLQQLQANALLEQFDAMILHRADNKDFFEWPEIHNGVQIIGQ